MADPIDVLVVDDNDDIRKLLVVRLRLDDRFGAVLEAANGNDGVAVAREHAELGGVVLDQEMPGATGLEALPHIRAALPGARIVMYTSDDSVHEQAQRLGADETVTKPSTIERVLDLLAVP